MKNKEKNLRNSFVYIVLFSAIIEVFILAVEFEQKISVLDKAYFIVEEQSIKIEVPKETKVIIETVKS